MRHRVFAAAAAAFLLFAPVTASAQYIEFGPGGVRVDDGRGYGRRAGGGGYCETLRRACENKEALGEVGQGNCRRYRAECGGRPVVVEERRSLRQVCRELRQACLYKDELGERGRGNCREYRETCQGF